MDNMKHPNYLYNNPIVVGIVTNTSVRTVLTTLCQQRSELLHADGRINQTELARCSGVNQPTIKRILDGESLEPKVANLQKLADYFGVTISQIRGEAPLTKMQLREVRERPAKYGDKIPASFRDAWRSLPDTEKEEIIRDAQQRANRFRKR